MAALAIEAPDVFQFDPNGRRSIAALDRKFDFPPDAHGLELLDQIGQPPGRLSVGTGDDVAEFTRDLVDAAQSGCRGG